MSGKKHRAYTPEYPYTLLAEALAEYRAEVFKDDEARNGFLVRVQPLVRHLVGRSASVYGGELMRSVDDVIGFVNVSLLESWLPAYLKSARKADRIPEAVRWLSKSVRGYVLTYIRRTYDPRVMPVVEVGDVERAFARREDREEIAAAISREIDEHVALRRRDNVDIEVVMKLMKYLVWRQYKENDGVPS